MVSWNDDANPNRVFGIATKDEDETKLSVARTVSGMATKIHFSQIFYLVSSECVNVEERGALKRVTVVGRSSLKSIRNVHRFIRLLFSHGDNRRCAPLVVRCGGKITTGIVTGTS